MKFDGSNEKREREKEVVGKHSPTSLGITAKAPSNSSAACRNFPFRQLSSSATTHHHACLNVATASIFDGRQH